jgi:hypothetical protein
MQTVISNKTPGLFVETTPENSEEAAGFSEKISEPDYNKPQ